MRWIILVAAAVAAIGWGAWPGAAARLPANVQPLVLPMLATVVAAALLARYFDWRGNLRRRIATAERRHPAAGPTDRDRERDARAA